MISCDGKFAVAIGCFLDTLFMFIQIIMSAFSKITSSKA